MVSIEELENYIKEGELLKVRLSDRLNTLEEQYKQVASELQKLGINPETALEDIEKKEKEYNVALEELEKELPIDVINKYRNYSFTNNGVNQTQAPF